ncbi:MAG: ABC transporter permease [Armatimonadetes bacterium]|nr:ABC transporter permease [Armatimonadota bacterium]
MSSGPRVGSESWLAQRRRQAGQLLGRACLAAALAVALVGLLPALVGVRPEAAVRALLVGAVGEPGNARNIQFAWTGTLLRTVPILLTGLSVGWAFRAGLFNIGAEGQLLWGALAAAWLGAAVPLPSALHIPLCLLGGAVAGAAWAWPTALLKTRRQVPEVVTTLLLSLIAGHLTTFVATHPLHDPTQQGPRTADILPSAYLPTPPGSRLHLGLLLALLVATGLIAVLVRARSGFQMEIVGRNAAAAHSAGVDVGKVWTNSLLVSGALAGLAGAIEVLGIHHFFLAGFSPGYGYEGIAVAVLGGNFPVGILFAALFWGGLANGAVELEVTAGVSRRLVTVVQALVILAVAVRRWPGLFRLASAGSRLGSGGKLDRPGAPGPTGETN